MPLASHSSSRHGEFQLSPGRGHLQNLHSRARPSHHRTSRRQSSARPFGRPGTARWSLGGLRAAAPASAREGVGMRRARPPRSGRPRRSRPPPPWPGNARRRPGRRCKVPRCAGDQHQWVSRRRGPNLRSWPLSRGMAKSSPSATASRRLSHVRAGAADGQMGIPNGGLSSVCKISSLVRRMRWGRGTGENGARPVSALWGGSRWLVTPVHV